MSNLWKALRDVSRDVDPTVGFEAPAHGLGADAPAPSPPVADQVSAPAAVLDAPSSPPDRPTLPRQAPIARRPGSTGRPRPAGSSGQTPQPAQPKERLAPLQSPLRRPLTTPLQFDTPASSNNVVRPAQFNRVVGPAPGPSWEPSASAPPVAPKASVTAAGTPAPATPAKSRLSSILESGAPPAPRPPLSPDAAPSTPSAPPAPRPPLSSGPALARPRPNVGVGRQGEPVAPVAPSANLPDALRPFAPGAPDIQMDMTALSLSPRWRPGDDDVMPSDGHKGAHRPRLRDRLPW